MGAKLSKPGEARCSTRADGPSEALPADGITVTRYLDRRAHCAGPDRFEIDRSTLAQATPLRAYGIHRSTACCGTCLVS